MSRDPLIDDGLQLERTDLAWRRTVLGLGIGGIVALRLLPPALGGWSIPLALIGVLSAVLMWILAIRRTRRSRRSLSSSRPLPGAALLLQLALTVSGGAALGLVFAALPG